MDRPAFIEVNGVSLRYQLSGSGPRTVVLLHEMSSFLECWDEIAPDLETDHLVLKYDARGFGLSEKVWPESFQQLAADLRGLLKALSIELPVTVVGSAMGGPAGLVYAATWPDEVTAVVALAPAINIPPVPADAPAPTLPSTMRQVVDARLDVLYNAVIRTPERLTKFRAMHQASHPSVTASTLKMMSSSDFHDILPKVRCPSLVVAAGLFAQRSPETIRQVADALPNARFEVLATDHIMTVQSPELVLPLLRDFLQEVEA
jgi:3-oxoadipate enol-lactonase